MLKILLKNPLPTLLIFLLIMLLIIFILNIIFKKDKIGSPNKIYNLKRDGFCIFSNVLNNNEINILKQHCFNNEYEPVQNYLLKNSRMNDLIRSATNENYQFQDYIWIIQKSAVHTCHRDNNGDFFNKNQKYPSYTMLVYLENMEKCLGVIPESHREPNSYFINFTDSLTNLLCKSGDVILFNANLIHVGTINANEDNLRIQLKVTHKDDIPYIMYYENFHKVLNEDNNIPQYLRKIQRNLSCTFPGISDMTQQKNIESARGSDNGANISIAQKMFSYLFYGNSKFYDLPNAY
jgi:hypothetical protein